MTADINRLLEGKSILILGYGREGRSTFSFLKEYFPEAEVGIADLAACPLDEGHAEAGAGVVDLLGQALDAEA